MSASSSSSHKPALRAATLPSAEVLPGRRLRKRRILLPLLALVVVVLGLIYVAQWWLNGRFVVSTDDAYVQADAVAVAPRVGGYVSQVLVTDNQAVTFGQPLIRIEDDTYQAALARQQADLNTRQTGIAVAQAQFEQQQAATEQAQATLAGAEIAARYAASQQARYGTLVASGAETAERLAEMVNNHDMAEATVRSDTAALHSAQRLTATMQAQIDEARAQGQAAQTAIRAADLDVQHTTVTASIAGVVGDRTVVAGQFVQPGTRLMSIVPVQQSYVLANFKETQIGGMRIGQRVDVEVDSLGDRVLHGRIDSFAPGTGSEFALLPPENATGNFTKIVQRVPVKIVIDTDAQTRARLVPGLSVSATIDTRNRPDGAKADAAKADALKAGPDQAAR